MGGKGSGYVPKDGVLVCPADGGGNLFTAKEYAQPNLVRHPLARALSVLRGDKYMADAYPPAPKEKT